MLSRGLGRSAFLFLLVGVAVFAQRSRSNVENVVDIQVRVTYEDDHPVGQMLRVELMNESNIPIQQMFTNSEGQTTFRVSGPGTFRVRVTGSEIEEGFSEPLTVNALDRARMLFVRVKPTASANERSNQQPGKMTSAAQLRVPPEARKLFDKGTEAWQKKDYEKAVDFYQQAITAYPPYDAAYNNLGAAYMKLAQTDKALTAFQTAVKLNDKNADADRNLSRLLLRNGEYAKAEEFAKKSLMVEPSDAAGLTLVAIAELKNGEYAAAVRNAQKVHQGPHDGSAACHYVAGQALEHLNQPQNARGEYQLYLQEMPDGPEAAQVRTALSRIDDQIANEQ